MRALGRCLLKEARAIRAAYPDADAMRGVAISALNSESFHDDAGAAEFWAALGYLRAEMVLVRDAGAGTVGVLDDEIANVVRLYFRV